MPNRAILAVDPGQSGAVAVLRNPTVWWGTTVKGIIQVRRDFKSLGDIARAVLMLSEGVTDALIEKVHAMPGQGVVSMFSFGRSTGVAYGALEVSLPGIVVEEVTPQKWQQFYRGLLSIPKEEPFDARAVCSKVVPDSAQFLTRKKDHNTADAILIAAWKVLSPA